MDDENPYSAPKNDTPSEEEEKPRMERILDYLIGSLVMAGWAVVVIAVIAISLLYARLLLF